MHKNEAYFANKNSFSDLITNNNNKKNIERKNYLNFTFQFVNMGVI